MYSFKRPSDDLGGSAAGRTEEEPQMIEFSWSPSEDDNTASAGLTYALRIGTASGKSDVFDAKANADGSRRNLPEPADKPAIYGSVKRVPRNY